MVKYRKILEYLFNGIKQRTIEVAVGSSRNIIRDIVNRVKERGVTSLTVNAMKITLVNTE